MTSQHTKQNPPVITAQQYYQPERERERERERETEREGERQRERERGGKKRGGKKREGERQSECERESTTLDLIYSSNTCTCIKLNTHRMNNSGQYNILTTDPLNKELNITLEETRVCKEPCLLSKRLRTLFIIFSLKGRALKGKEEEEESEGVHESIPLFQSWQLLVHHMMEEQ